ncbi:MAG: hypothetical protein FWF65_09570 [Bacteroidetes bacterium]|nr:hypothetical protein [Bacteroidota bacterium]
MTIRERKSNARVSKILLGLEMAYEKLIADKRAKNAELVVLRNNKIINIKP